MIKNDDKLAIHGGTPVKKNPYETGMRYGKAEEEAVLNAIRSQQLCYIQGTEVYRTEKL